MRPLFVITLQPFRADLPDLIEGFKHIGIQYFGAIRSIEPLDERISIGTFLMEGEGELDSRGGGCLWNVSVGHGFGHGSDTVLVPNPNVPQSPSITPWSS